MSKLLQDVRFGLAMMRKRPGFTLVALTALALGIGANTAIFSAINSILLRALPYEGSEQLVRIHVKPGQFDTFPVSPETFTCGAIRQPRSKILLLTQIKQDLDVNHEKSCNPVKIGFRAG